MLLCAWTTFESSTSSLYVCVCVPFMCTDSKASKKAGWLQASIWAGNWGRQAAANRRSKAFSEEWCTYTHCSVASNNRRTWFPLCFSGKLPQMATRNWVSLWQWHWLTCACVYCLPAAVVTSTFCNGGDSINLEALAHWFMNVNWPNWRHYRRRRFEHPRVCPRLNKSTSIRSCLYIACPPHSFYTCCAKFGPLLDHAHKHSLYIIW